MLKSLLLALLLPPLNLVVLALLGLALTRWRLAFGRALAIAAMLGLLAFAMPAVSDSLLVALETGLADTKPPADPPQAIVILGAEIVRVRGGVARARVGALTLERLRTGAELARRTGLPVLVTGGVTQPTQLPVGSLMAQSMKEDFRVPVRWVESESRDTWENAADSAALLRPDGIRSIYLVTHGWHMKRALAAFAPTGLAVTPAPTPLDTGGTLTLTDLIPRPSAWQTGYFALHEWIGRAWYAFR
jgi:uncharacterized SAM-binding protein YcdF (DUF218 family)